MRRFGVQPLGCGFKTQQKSKLKLELQTLSIIADRLNRTAAHRLITQRLLLFRLRLLVNKRVVVLVTAHEILRRGVAADVAVDARRIHVIGSAHVFFHFVVLVRHANLRSGMRHLMCDDPLIKLFTCQKTEFYCRVAQTDLLLVSVLSNLGGFVVTDVRVQGSNEH